MPYNIKKPMSCTVGDLVKSHEVYLPLYPEPGASRRARQRIRKSFSTCRIVAVATDGSLHLQSVLMGNKTFIVSPLTVWWVKRREQGTSGGRSSPKDSE